MNVENVITASRFCFWIQTDDLNDQQACSCAALVARRLIIIPALKKILNFSNHLWFFFYNSPLHYGKQGTEFWWAACRWWSHYLSAADHRFGETAGPVGPSEETSKRLATVSRYREFTAGNSFSSREQTHSRQRTRCCWPVCYSAVTELRWRSPLSVALLKGWNVPERWGMLLGYETGHLAHSLPKRSLLVQNWSGSEFLLKWVANVHDIYSRPMFIFDI